MRLKTLLLIFSFVAAMGTVQAQDFHYTQFDMSPLTINPSLTGAYEGTFRVGGIYRDQWGSVLGDNSFTTPSFYIDAPIIQGFSKKHWIGVGATFLSDQVGEYNYQNMLLGGSIAYHIGIGNKTTVSIGGELMNVQRRLDRTMLKMESGYDFLTNQFTMGAFNDASIAENVSYIDIGAGLNVSTAFGGATGDKYKLNIGAAADHLNAPNDGFQGSEALPIRIASHAKLDAPLNGKWVLSPTVLFQTMAGATEINTALMIGYQVNDNFLLQYGQGWRVGDATNAILAFQYDRLRAGISYDINVSSLSNVSNYQGGFELGLSYIAKIYKQPESSPVIFCPRF